MSKKDAGKTPNTKLKTSAIKRKTSRGKTPKLQSSTWYEGAARSVRISNQKHPEKNDWVRE